MRSSDCGAARNASSCRPSPAPGPESALVSSGRPWFDGLLAVLLAPTCLSCGALLQQPSAGPVCSRCWQSIRPLSPPLCDRCGEPVPSARVAAAESREPEPEDLSRTESPLRAQSPPRAQSQEPGAFFCVRCRHQPSPISIGRSAGAYEGALRQLIHALKYEGRRSLARPLAALMRDRCADALAGADLVVPVPLHWRRRLTRGFNQAEDLAKGLGLPACRALRRVRATRPQFGLRPGDRQRNVDGAFRARRRGVLPGADTEAHRVAGARVVLVDDLATTGATLRECAEILARLGAREVRTATAARALSPRSG